VKPLQRPIGRLARVVLSILSAVLIVIAVMEYALSDKHPAGDLAVTVFYCVCIAFIPIRPTLAAVILIVANPIAEFTPIVFSINAMWGTWLALGALGFCATYWLGIAALGYACVEMFIAFHIGHTMGTNVYGLINMFAIHILCYIASLAIRWKGERDSQRELQRQLAQTQINNAIATTIHDVTSNNLTNIILLSRQQLETSVDRNQWQKVNDIAVTTLNQIHQVIDVLNGTSSPAQPAKEGRSFMERLEHLVEQESASLREQHYEGETHIDGLSKAIDDDIAEAFLALLHETYTNIPRHAPSHGTYRITIRCNNDAITVMETNQLALPHTLIGIPHGKGLALHRQRIEALGGLLRTDTNQNHWNLYIQIPTHHVILQVGDKTPETR
jgi:signal transduction histidine kinase